MVLLKYKVNPADMQAKINVALSASPAISLSDPAAELRLTLELCIDSSVKEGQPITFMVEKTVFEVHDEVEGGMDIFSLGAFGGLRSTTQDTDTTKNISLGAFRVNGRLKSDSLDLKERGHRFITIPGDESTVTVTHTLNWERIFKYEGKHAKDDLVPGEKFDIGTRKDYLGTMWWCWGDLETDLKDKKLHVWHPGPFAGDKPNDDFVWEGNWVLGEAPMLLDWQDVTKDGRASFEVVE
ncbi:hypothetical protein HD806DRAFT_29219 [Xylariaceae sp. AK1471]|nr:hypothetical protein HD806DRAFT_29219 [Xylariaceae sp. AK1471]